MRPEDCGSKRAGGLSGGNQQKVIIGREISMNPDTDCSSADTGTGRGIHRDGAQDADPRERQGKSGALNLL